MATRTGAQVGKVTRVTEAGAVYVELADVAAGFEFGPVLDTVGGLVKGDRVIVTSLTRDADELVVIGKLGGTEAGGVTAEDLEAALVPYAEDVELTALADATADALDLKVDDTDPRLTDARTPTAHNHDDRYYTEAEVDALIAASDLKRATVCNNANVTTFSGTPTIDGIVTAPGDRILLVGQTSSSTNGLWLIPPDAGAWVRPADYDSAEDALASHVLVQRGTLRGGRIWRNNLLSLAAWPAAHSWTDTGSANAIIDGVFALNRLPVAPSGNSNATQIVRADDARLSNARTPTAHSHTMSDLPAAAAALAAYPVGAIFISVVNTSPATLFGGTWAVHGTGRVLVGVDTSQTEFATVQQAGGAKTHTLSLAEIPNVTGSFQNHAGEGGSTMWAPTGVFSGSSILSGAYRAAGAVIGGAHSMINAAFNLGGGGGAHNNLQPYTTVYMWRRTA